MTEFVPGPVRGPRSGEQAHLGPGFDALGLALDLTDVLTGEVTDPESAAVLIEVSGEGAGSVRLDETHLVHRAMTRGFAAGWGSPPPAYACSARTRSRTAGVWGSSSAAIVGGLVMARELVADGHDRLPDERSLRDRRRPRRSPG